MQGTPCRREESGAAGKAALLPLRTSPQRDLIIRGSELWSERAGWWLRTRNLSNASKWVWRLATASVQLINDTVMARDSKAAMASDCRALSKTRKFQLSSRGL